MYIFFVFQEEDIPLFLGADVLAGASVLTKNHGRIHSRYAKDKFASKVGLQGNRKSVTLVSARLCLD